RALDERRRGNALVRPVIGAPRRQLLVGLLPEKFTVRFAKRHQDAAVARLLGIAHAFVVRPDEHHAAGDHGVAVALRSEIRNPLPVLLALDVPLDGEPFHVRDHVAIRRPAPHGPVAGTAGIGRDQAGCWCAPREEERDDTQVDALHWFATIFRLSMYAPNSA